MAENLLSGLNRLWHTFSWLPESMSWGEINSFSLTLLFGFSVTAFVFGSWPGWLVRVPAGLS